MNKPNHVNGKLKVLILAVLCVTMLSACMSKIPGADAEKEVNLYLTYVPSNLDPETVFSADNSAVLELYVEGLMTKDQEGHVIPGIAERYEVSGDGLTYRFYIREDAMWSNGVPVTADDFVFGWQRVLDPNTASDASFLFLNCVDMVGAAEIFYGGAPLEMLGAKAVSEKVLEVNLNRPCPYFTDLLCCTPMVPCNREFYYSHMKDYGKNAEGIISCGPYTVDYYEPLGMQLHLSKNGYYYDADAIRIPGINIQILSDVQQLIMSFEKGEADMIPISGEQQEVSTGDPRMVERPASQIEYMVFNPSNPALSNKNIRRALTMTVNRDTIIRIFYREGSYEMTRLCPEKIFFEPDGSDFAGDQGRYDDLCAYNVEKAREYWQKGLEELGVTEITADFLTVTADNLFLDILKEEWENDLPGFTLNYRIVPSKAYFETMMKGEFDICEYGYIADYGDPSTFLNLFRIGSFANYGGYDSEEYNAIMDACECDPVVNDPTARMEMLHRAEDLLIEDAVFIPMVAVGGAELVSDRLHGVVFTPLSPSVNFRYAVKEAE